MEDSDLTDLVNAMQEIRDAALNDPDTSADDGEQEIDTDSDSDNDVDSEAGEDGEQDNDDNFSRLSKLNKKLLTRVLTPDERDYFVNKDIETLKKLRSELEDRKLQLSNAAAKQTLKLEAKQAEQRKIELRKKYSV
jgi:hypothetical protein